MQASRHLTPYQLGFLVALNSFKQHLLGDLHISGKHQTQAVFDALSKVAPNIGITERSWQSWFSDKGVVPKTSKISLLDQMAVALDKSRNTKAALPKDYYLSMVQGGLANALAAQTESKQPLQALVVRAFEYQPLSMLHLHLDAIRINALVTNVSAVDWTQVMRIGAQQVFEILHQKWNPRNGWIYKQLHSKLRQEWDSASPDKQRLLRQEYDRFHPRLFNRIYENGAWPNWGQCGIESDISSQHIYKLLFSIAADTEFLVSSSFTHWYLDLCTAGLALHALAMSDRYAHFGVRTTSEGVFIQAFQEIFFPQDDSEFDYHSVAAAMLMFHADWSEMSLDVMLRARESYFSSLNDLGLSAPEVLYLANACWRTHPLIYEPGADSDMTDLRCR